MSKGIVPAADQEAIARTEYEQYTRNALVQLRSVREGAQVEEAHMRNRQMVVRWLMANTKAIDVKERDSRTYYLTRHLGPPQAFHFVAPRAAMNLALRALRSTSLPLK